MRATLSARCGLTFTADLAERSGLASLAAVVAVEADGSRQVMSSWMYPLAAKRIVAHYEHLWGLVQPQEEQEQ